MGKQRDTIRRVKVAECRAVRTGDAQKYYQYYMKSPIPKCIWQRRESDFVLTDFNQAAEKLSNGAMQMFLGKGLEAVFSQEPEMMKAVRGCFEQRGTFRREMRRKPHFSDEYRYFDMTFAYIEPDSVMVTLEDITRRKSAEEELQEMLARLEQRVTERTGELERINRALEKEIAERLRIEQELLESRERYRSQFEDSLAVMLIIDSRTGAIVDANPAACDFYGYDRETITSMKIFDINILPPDELYKEMQRARQTRSNHFHFRHRLASGEVRDVEVYSGPVRMDSGAMLFSIIHDVTERQEAEQRARQHQEELAHASRLISIGELASGLAHELNQPLCAILTHSEGCLSLLKTGKLNEDKLRGKLKTVVRQAERAGDIINRIKGFIRKEPPVRDMIDINEVIREAVSIFESEARRRGMRVVTELADSLPRVYADRVQIEQVLINLAQNGCDAMEQAPRDKRVLVIGTRMIPRGDVEVKVTDRGEGFMSGDIEKIFDPFYTTKQKGMGLGLSITRSIVEGHGGKLRAAHAEGGGAEIYFVLPVNKEL